MSTKIEWTDVTWNPVVGCERCSPGCDHCYAIRVAARELQPAHVGLTVGKDASGYAGPDWSGEVRLFPERLDEPLRWRKPRRCFVCSMSDLFHPDVPEAFIRGVWSTMHRADRHIFQVLTKRPQRLAALCRDRSASPQEIDDGCELGIVPGLQYDHPLPNLWLGTSVENQRYADLRIPHLLATPAAVRFLSVEPLFGPVDLAYWLQPLWKNGTPRNERRQLDWVIVGGESGPGARPMHPQWVRDLRDQCVAAGVPFFFKQWGEHVTEDQSPQDITLPSEGWYLLGDDDPVFYRVGKKAAGRELDGRTWDEYPS